MELRERCVTPRSERRRRSGYAGAIVCDDGLERVPVEPQGVTSSACSSGHRQRIVEKGRFLQNQLRCSAPDGVPVRPFQLKNAADVPFLSKDRDWVGDLASNGGKTGLEYTSGAIGQSMAYARFNQLG